MTGYLYRGQPFLEEANRAIMADRDVAGEPRQRNREYAVPVPHGTLEGYLERHCRCRDCKQARADDQDA